MTDYTAPRGTFDILPETSEEDKWQNSFLWQHVEKVLRETATLFGFKEIRTPVFERTELFKRSVGETSDIVSKEMYTFIDRGERSLTLRPEGTAAVARAFIENKLYASGLPHKVFYIGPMFRYERPQKGRYRQHHQFGAEAIGIGTPEQDVELIAMACAIYQRLGIQNLSVQINSVGDLESRTAYKQALTEFLRPHLSALSADSQERFSKNILRILDSKDPQDKILLEGAPKLIDFLTPVAKSHFERVLTLLTELKIPHVVDTKLVRGLDYYNHTVFEITASALGAQNAVGGGGRYDGLIEELGGPNLPSAGFGTGLERLLHVLLAQKAPLPEPPRPLIFLIPLDHSCLDLCLKLALEARMAGLYAEVDLSLKKVKHGMQLANSLKAVYSMVIGSEEIASQMGKLKHMETRESQDVPLESLISVLKSSRDKLPT